MSKTQANAGFVEAAGDAPISIASYTFKDRTLSIVCDDKRGEALMAARDAAIKAASKRTVAGMFSEVDFATGDTGEQILCFADALDDRIGSAGFRFNLAAMLADLPEEQTVRSTVAAIGPTDAVEALLASQMAAVHVATLKAAKRLGKADYVDERNYQEGALNRLARTFATQVEALRKHRSKGTQTVRHVHVNQGGQAVVADTFNNIREGGGGDG